jgi:hypothetical protein
MASARRKRPPKDREICLKDGAEEGTRTVEFLAALLGSTKIPLSTQYNKLVRFSILLIVPTASSF